jgi:rhamnosyltransferase
MLLSKQSIESNKHSKVAVLLATYNGVNYLSEQLDSILGQLSVEISLFVSDDSSSDGTYEKLGKLAQSNPQVFLLPRLARMGSAGKNFYRLICDVDLAEFDYVAFADQDDIWSLDKLSNHINLINQHEAEAVSSNVLAFWPNGAQKLIIKSQPQQTYDFLFESAGPGCTFLMTPWLVNKIKDQLLSNEVAKEVAMHDWLTYAVCRANEKRWIIDAIPSMRYRQHQHNVIGANAGFRSILARLKKINDRWYRHEVALITSVVSSINPDDKISKLHKIIQGHSICDQFRLLPYVLRGRRKLVDRLVLMLSVLFFIF